jgi:hypothetical protein
MDNGEPRCIALGGLRIDDAIEEALQLKKAARGSSRRAHRQAAIASLAGSPVSQFGSSAAVLASDYPRAELMRRPCLGRGGPAATLREPSISTSQIRSAL